MQRFLLPVAIMLMVVGFLGIALDGRMATGYANASYPAPMTEREPADWRWWATLVSGVVLALINLWLKWKDSRRADRAEARADRAEAREIHDRRNRGEDKA